MSDPEETLEGSIIRTTITVGISLWKRWTTFCLTLT